MAYRRDNREFRQHIARKASLSTWQTLVLGLVVNLVKIYCFVIAGIGSLRARE